jgi:hypothetical protein
MYSVCQNVCCPDKQCLVGLLTICICGYVNAWLTKSGLPSSLSGKVWCCQWQYILCWVLEGAGEGEEGRWGLRDCLERNQADTTFKFMKCLFQVCPNPWLHQSSEWINVSIAICMSAEGSEETGGCRVVTAGAWEFLYSFEYSICIP